MNNVAASSTRQDFTAAEPAGRGRGLEESLDEVRRLATRLQDIGEAERRLLASEIHDELSHRLTALKLDLMSLERELREVRPGLASRATSMRMDVDQIVGSARRMCAELRPGLLDDFGLIAAIEWQAEAFEQRTGIAKELAIHGEDADLSSRLTTAVFRLLQESLANVDRHAGAGRVRIALERDADRLRFEVRDDGSGFQPGLAGDPKSCGITGMRERVLALGGVFGIHSVAGGGTTVSAELPLREASGSLQSLPALEPRSAPAAAAR